MMGKSIYNKQDIENYKCWERDIVERNSLREVFPTQIMVHKIGLQQNKLKSSCIECKAPLEVEFGDYSKPLDEKMVLCGKGAPEDGHGWWASVVNIVIN
jgi:hypothetical protein